MAAATSAAAPSRRHFSTTRAHRDAPPKSPFQAFIDTLREELRKSQDMQDNIRQLSGEAGKMQDSETMKRMREVYERARIVTSLKENPRLMRAAETLRKNGGHVGEAVNATLKQMEESELIKGLGAVSSRLARQLADSTAPVRNTEAYKAFSATLIEAFDDGGSSLRLYSNDEADARLARRIRREARLRKIGRLAPLLDPEDAAAGAAAAKATDDPLVKAEAAGAAAGAAGAAQARAQDAAGAGAEQGSAEATSDQSPPTSDSSSSSSSSSKAKPKPRGYAVRVRGIAENPNAGEALVLRQEAGFKRAWSDFKDSNFLFRKMGEAREAYDESENPFVERLRGITETVGGWFAENETARVVGAFKMMEPSFTLDAFTRELREYVIPEIIDSYHSASRGLLRQWCGEATFNVLMATVDPYVQKGAIANGRLLDLKNVDILQAKMLENNVPVLIVSFSTQELMYFKDAKTGEIVAGSEERTDSCRYAMVLTRVDEEMHNEITGGWKVVELARRGQAAFL
ncbi:Tim44-domain-containing protein [Ceraceosorus guamensis]|uniref:Mitochondrial import inner membrane translocase subunit TIM44 n=1 Tax=Ceraceosorus guamensis TaxID=1522189 RepID=A0A316W9Q5_9BASI|nr:Tim44-domain-containing protein [Ceraceosorus guamensis]PWN44395.1 Tim44-domain-containing protein [Ceraceosorus guamensis]